MKRVILTGERNRGKTSVCRLLAAEAISRGLTVTGILSLKEISEGELKAIWASNCREEEKRKLARFIPEAERPAAEKDGSKTPSWNFYSEAFLWGNALMAEAPPADLFILDEAGPLEFDPGTTSPQKDSAWTAGMERMDKGIDRTALIVVRPELVDQARRRWPDAEPLKAPDSRSGRSETDRLIEMIIGK